MKLDIPDRRLLLLFFLGSITLILICGCVVVKHDEEGNKKKDDGVTFYFQDGSFDAAAYVTDIWDNQVVPAFLDSSNMAFEVLEALDKDSTTACDRYGNKAEIDSPYTFKVRGSAKIVAANTESAASTVELAVDGYSGDQKILMQIGPVIKKSAIRDSLDFINFGDFTNQLEYASVSKELNFKVRDDIVAGLDRENLIGMNLNFYGSFIFVPRDPVLITPVIINSGEFDD